MGGQRHKFVIIILRFRRLLIFSRNKFDLDHLFPLRSLQESGIHWLGSKVHLFCTLARSILYIDLAMSERFAEVLRDVNNYMQNLIDKPLDLSAISTEKVG